MVGRRSTEAKNAMCELPPAGAACDPPRPLGPVAGDVGAFHESHGLVISLRNLRRWYASHLPSTVVYGIMFPLQRTRTTVGDLAD